MRRKYGLLSSTVCLSWALAGGAEGAQVGGRVAPPSADPVSVGALGHSRTRVAQPSAEARSRRSDVAVFLKVRDSLPIPESAARWRVEVVGAQLRPEVVACAVDETVEFVNLERRTVTVSLGGTVLGPIEPGATASHTCRHGGRVAVKIAELPHLEGSLYVGESVGVAARPDATGRFALSAPKGSYELRVLGRRGVLFSKEVSVDRTDVDLGLIELGGAAPAPEPVPASAAPPPPAPAPTPAPVEPPSAAASKVKAVPPPVPKPAKLKLEKPDAAAPGAEGSKPEPKPAEPKPAEPKGSEEPAPAKLPTPTKPKVEKKAEDDFFELEP